MRTETEYNRLASQAYDEYKNSLYWAGRENEKEYYELDDVEQEAWVDVVKKMNELVREEIKKLL